MGRAISSRGNWAAPMLNGLARPVRPGSYLDEMDAAKVVAAWTHGAHIVGAVPNFDAEVLASLLRYNGLTPAWHYHLRVRRRWCR